MTLFRDLFAAALVVCGPSVALADLDVMSKGMSLGGIIGSEEYCGLTYDQDAISAWIDKNVPADEMSFQNYLSMGINSEAYDQPDRSASAKTAHCSSVKRTAAHYGFIKQ